MALWHKKYMRAFRGCDTLSTPSIPHQTSSQGFFGHESASGDFLTAINYFDFRDDMWGGKKALVLSSATPTHTHTRTHRGAITNLWKSRLSHGHSSSRACERGNEVTLRRHPLSNASAKSLQQGCRASKTSDTFLSHFIVVSLPDLRGRAVTTIKRFYFKSSTNSFSVFKRTQSSPLIF